MITESWQDRIMGTCFRLFFMILSSRDSVLRFFREALRRNPSRTEAPTEVKPSPTWSSLVKASQG